MIVQDWLTIVVGSLQDLWIGFMGVLGNLLGALIVFLVGLIVASGLGAFVEKIVGLIKLDKLLESLGVQEYFERAGISLNSARFFGRVTYWFLVVVFLLAASDILGFSTLSQFLKDVLLYVPNVVVAVLIMLSTIIVANFLRVLVRSAVKSAKLQGYKFLGSLTWWSVVRVDLLAAVSQLGVAQDIINTLVGGFVAMLALAGGIAFGLGGKDYAAFLVSRIKDHHDE